MVKEQTDIKHDKIVLIFKQRDYNKDTLKFAGGAYSPSINPITYIDEFPFEKKIIRPNNIKTSDTIVIDVNNQIVLNHRYHYYYESSYILKPGDTVVFNYKNDAPYCNIINKKIGNDFSKDLNFEVDFNLSNKVYKNKADFYFSHNKRFRTSKEEATYKNQINLFLSKKRLLLDSAFKSSEISKKDYTYLKNKLHFKNLFLTPLSEVDSINVNKSSNLIYDDYRHYIKYYAAKKFNIGSIKISNGSIIDHKSAFDSVSASPIFSGEVEKYLLYSYLKKIAVDFSIDDLNTYVSKIESKTQDSLLVEKIKKRYVLDLSELKKDTEKVYLTNSRKKQVTLSEIIKLNKGKLIFVDFWASWCAPCREVMPESKKLHQEYKDKNIVFIYISIDKDFEKWINASKEENLLYNKNSFFAINYPSANFYRELSLSSIPRYLLYDKEGKLIHKNSPGPGSVNLKKTIDKNIEL